MSKKFKKIIDLGPGYAPIIVTGDTIDEVTERYRKELATLKPLVGGGKVPHKFVDKLKEDENEGKEVKRLIDTHTEKMVEMGMDPPLRVPKKPMVVRKVETTTSQPTPKMPKPAKKTKVVDATFPDSDKPKIVLVTDVIGWAWWIKSQYLIKHLSDDFDFITIAAQERRSTGINWREMGADLFLTYGWDFVHHVKGVDKNRIISGITAHKDKTTWQNGVLRTLKDCDWVHANSIMLKEALEEGGVKDVYYVPNGVDENLFVEKKPVNLYSEKLVAGHVGKLAGLGGKGQKEFLEPAAAQAGVIWKGHYNNYTNRVEHDKMVDFYQDIDAFFVASITDGTPNGALEAAACGRPVVTNKIGNMPEFIVNGVNGFLVERKVEDYVEKMKALDKDRDMCYEMGQAARRTIEEGWTWTIMAENYRKMFWDVIKKLGIK